MAIVVAIIVMGAVFYAYDHVRYWRKLDDFERRASEFATMYEILEPKVVHGDPEEPDVDEFVFEGEIYNAAVKKDDLNSLYMQMKLAIADVLDSYDRIGERYLSLMDDETEERVSELHSAVERIDGIVRYQCWLKGIK